MADSNFNPISVLESTNANGYTTGEGAALGALKILQFPLDIGVSSDVSAPQQSHYMVFHINEVKAGQFGKNTELNLDKDIKDVPVFMESGSSHSSKSIDSVLRDPSKRDKVANIVAVGAGGVAGAAALGGLGVLGSVVGAGIGAEVGTTKAVVNATSTILKDIYDIGLTEIKRTKLTVVLPMPEQLGTSYDPNWASDDNMLIGNIAGIADRISDQGIGTSTILKAIATKLGGSAVQNVTQKAVNPRTQMLFSNMNFRSFTWTWTLYPRNKDEAKALWDIIEFVKYHILPEYDEQSGGVFLIQPSLFDIEFHSFGQRNDYLPKTLTCVCKNLTVDYAPAGTVAFFEPYYDEGTERWVSAPIGVRLSMSFEENEILTKNRVNPSTDGRYTFNQGKESNRGTF